LDPNKTLTCKATGAAIAGQYDNQGTATGSFGPVSDDGGPPKTITVTASNPDHYFGADPKIGIVTKTNGTSDLAPPLAIRVNTPVVWTYEVTNQGNVTLSGVTVTDSQPGVEVRCPKTTLMRDDPPMTCSAQGTTLAVTGPHRTRAPPGDRLTSSPSLDAPSRPRRRPPTTTVTLASTPRLPS
jgi:hypothetical protein